LGEVAFTTPIYFHVLDTNLPPLKASKNSEICNFKEKVPRNKKRLKCITPRKKGIKGTTCG